jgi:uncharacterized protein (DUF1330 family)
MAGGAAMSAYVVVEVEVLDKEKYESYKQLVPASIARYGGRFVVRGGKVQNLEGAWSPERLVILEFPSPEKAIAWWNSEEYAEAKAIRQESAQSRMIIAEGV